VGVEIVDQARPVDRLDPIDGGLGVWDGRHSDIPRSPDCFALEQRTLRSTPSDSQTARRRFEPRGGRE